MVKRQLQSPSGAPRWAATRGRPKDQLWLAMIETGDQSPLTRSRRSDCHVAGQTTMVDSHRQHGTTVRPHPEPIRPPPETVRPPPGPVIPPCITIGHFEWSSCEVQKPVNEGRNKKITFKPMFDYLLNKYTKVGPKDRAMKRSRSPMR
jgi:hypothetical protein